MFFFYFYFFFIFIYLFFFFFWRLVGWLCGGGAGTWEFAPPHFLPNPIHIYSYGYGGWRDRQVIQDSAYLARMIIKLARIIFAALKLPI